MKYIFEKHGNEIIPSLHDGEPDGFKYLSMDQALLYLRRLLKHEWHAYFPFMVEHLDRHPVKYPKRKAG